MPYPPILRDSQGSPIPQIWDGANWKPYRANTPLVTTHQNAAAANGNGVAADVDGYGSAMFQVTGTFSATVNFEGSVDGVTFVPIFVIDSNGNRVATTTSTGIFKADIAGLKSIRARISNYVSGSVTVVSRALPMARPTEQSVVLNGRSALLTGQRTIAAPGTPVAIASAQSCSKVMVLAFPTNAGNIYVGPAGLTKTTSLVLPPGGYVVVGIDNVSKIHVDADIAGDGVCWEAE